MSKVTIYGPSRITFIDISPQIRGNTRFRFVLYDTHTDDMMTINDCSTWSCIQDLTYDYKQEKRRQAGVAQH